MSARLPLAICSALLAGLLLASPAVAGDNGEGLLGELNDVIITFFSLGVLVFFFLVVCLGSYIQNRLDRRKEERKASKLRQRTGW
jgi:nitrogen fixation/metabolism regulation signal transduction histidine kinase